MVREHWETLKRRVNIAYYIGEKRLAELDSHINGTTDPVDPGVDVDIDGDGKADVNIRVKK